MGNSDVQERIQQYLAKAHQVLSTGWLALEHHDYITFVARIERALEEMGDQP